MVLGDVSVSSFVPFGLVACWPNTKPGMSQIPVGVFSLPRRRSAPAHSPLRPSRHGELRSITQSPERYSYTRIMPVRDFRLLAVTTMSCRASRRYAMRSGIVSTPSRFHTIASALSDTRISELVAEKDGPAVPVDSARITQVPAGARLTVAE